MIELIYNKLVFSFPQVHKDATGSVEFQRTLRIPDDNNEYPLPPGLGAFPLFHVDDFAKKVPQNWGAHGGVFFPMYQSEAMWVNFSGSYPMAIKIAAGKINAVTGDDWNNDIQRDPQDYIVIPEQPWLDGFCIDKGKIRQFTAMPLDKGYTAEEQITGKAEHGGLQIIAYPMKAEVYKRLFLSNRQVYKKSLSLDDDMMMCECAAASEEMGLAPGGVMTQEIYDDPYGFDVWDLEHASRVFVHIANSEAFARITGMAPPTEPPSAEDYNNAGMPWFDYYKADAKVLSGKPKLANLDSVAAKAIKLAEKPFSDSNKSIEPKIVHKLGSNVVRDGDF